MNTAILFNIFNRPELTKTTFAAIRSAQPPRLYVAADGPRAGKERDDELCRLTRQAATAVDWPCEVKTLFRKRNLGCKTACSTAISWFFQHEPEGIILEDDCLPHPDFFPYCENLLARYRHEPKVMFISGSNFDYGKKRGAGSYYFSVFPHVWGWASWADTWQYYDIEMQGLERFASTRMPLILKHEEAAKVMLKKFMLVARGIDSSWAFPLVYSLWKQGGLSIIPNVNMIENTGYVEDSAHPAPPDIRMHRKVEGMPEVMHPSAVAEDKAARFFACEILANEYGRGSLPEVFVAEGFRRLQDEDWEANRELIRVLKAFYAPFQGLFVLEVLNSLGAGDNESAVQAYSRLAELYPQDDAVRELRLKLLAAGVTV